MPDKIDTIRQRLESIRGRNICILAYDERVQVPCVIGSPSACDGCRDHEDIAAALEILDDSTKVGTHIVSGPLDDWVEIYDPPRHG